MSLSKPIRTNNDDRLSKLMAVPEEEDKVFKPFKLLNLPYLAMEQVVKNMSLMEAFNLSLCYPTLRCFVKSIFKKQKVMLSIEITVYISFRLESSNGSFAFFGVREYPDALEDLDGCMRMKVGKTSKIPFYYNKPKANYSVTYWRDAFKGATELYPLILDLFNIHFEKLHVWKEKINYDYESVVDWINQVNRPIEDVYFAKGTVEDTLYSQIINSENFQKCVIQQNPSENFQLPEFRFTNAHVNWQVYNAHWITLENLSEIGSVCLRLDDVKLADREVNLLLRTLVTGKFPNLELLALKANRSDMNRAVIMDGITDLENNALNWDVRVFDRYGYNITVEGTIDVQMTTGETCSLKYWNGVHSGVTIVIWK